MEGKGKIPPTGRTQFDGEKKRELTEIFDLETRDGHTFAQLIIFALLNLSLLWFTTLIEAFKKRRKKEEMKTP